MTSRARLSCLIAGAALLGVSLGLVAWLMSATTALSIAAGGCLTAGVIALDSRK